MSKGTPIQALKAAEVGEKELKDQQEYLEAVASGKIKPGEPLPGEGGGKPEPEKVEATPEPKKAEPTVETKTEEEKLRDELAKEKHKYDVLKGKYDAEVPGMAGQLRETRELIQSLRSEVESLKKPEPKPEPKPMFNPQDPNVEYLKREYPELWEAQEKVMGKFAEDTSRQITELQAQLETERRTNVEDKKTRFYTDLDGGVKNWRVINGSQEFNDWLDQTEPFTGFLRRDILADAYNKLNIERVKSFYTTFLAAQAPPVSSEGGGKKTVTEDIGMETATAGAKKPVDQTKPKIIKSFKASEVKDFYESLSRHTYRGTKEEAEKIEKEINMAIAGTPGYFIVPG